MNTTNTQPIQNVLATASRIADLIAAKGVCFAGFDYNGKRRNVTLGKDLSKDVKGVGNWGKTSVKGSIVSHNGEIYLQGEENNLETGKQIKRFRLDRATNFVVG